MKIFELIPLRIRNVLVSYSFVMPLIIVFFVFNLFPLANSFYVSLFVEYYEDARFVGFENYQNLGNEVSGLKPALLNILIFLPISIVIIQSISLMVAKIITRTPKLIQYCAVIIFFLPYMLPEATISSIFARVFFSDTGMLANFVIWMNDHAITSWLMSLLGEGVEDKVEFLHRSKAVNPILFIYIYIIFCWIIKFCGFFCLIYYISLQSIQKDIVEAASLEGAGLKDIFLKIEIPLIKPMIAMMSVLSFIFLLSSSSLQISTARNVIRDQAQYTESISGLLYTLWAEVSMLGAAAWVYVLFIASIFFIGYVLFLLFRRVFK